MDAGTETQGREAGTNPGKYAKCKVSHRRLALAAGSPTVRSTGPVTGAGSADAYSEEEVYVVVLLGMLLEMLLMLGVSK